MRVRGPTAHDATPTTMTGKSVGYAEIPQEDSWSDCRLVWWIGVACHEEQKVEAWEEPWFLRCATSAP